MNLSEFQKKHGIKRIDFSKVKPSYYETEYNTDKLVCPYCGQKIFYEEEETYDILQGEPYKCERCEKWFYAEGEVCIDTTCTPIEEKVLGVYTRHCIEKSYKHMDECDKNGCEWDRPYGVVEWETYKKFAEPLFENMKKDGECAL